MSSIEALPLLTTITGVQTNEDFIYSLAFYYDDNITAIPLTGINFTASVGTIATLSTSNGAIVVSGTDDNILTITEYAASKTSWLAGSYPLTLLATDGTYTRDIFAQSQLVVGAPYITSVVPLNTGGNMPTAVATYLPPALANLLLIQTQLLNLFSVTELTTSQTILLPGIYVVKTTGVTITLPITWSLLGGVTIADGTGLVQPNFYVTGTIGGVASTSLEYVNSQQSITFYYDMVGATWVAT